MKEFIKPPLPFIGNKTRMRKSYLELLDYALLCGAIDEHTTFYDMFGGSGLMAHITKRKFPKNNVVWNDYDNFQSRLDMIPQTNEILIEALEFREGNPSVTKEELSAFARALSKKYKVLDLITISAWLCFNTELLNKSCSNVNLEAFYKKMPKNIISCDGYLKGVTRVKDCAKNIIKNAPSNSFLIADPPYIGTYSKTYRNGFSKEDYKDIFTSIKKPYCFFGSGKGRILELFEEFSYLESVKGYNIYNTKAIFFNGNGANKDTDYLIYNL